MTTFKASDGTVYVCKHERGRAIIMIADTNVPTKVYKVGDKIDSTVCNTKARYYVSPHKDVSYARAKQLRII